MCERRACGCHFTSYVFVVCLSRWVPRTVGLSNVCVTSCVCRVCRVGYLALPVCLVSVYLSCLCVDICVADACI